MEWEIVEIIITKMKNLPKGLSRRFEPVEKELVNLGIGLLND